METISTEKKEEIGKGKEYQSSSMYPLFNLLTKLIMIVLYKIQINYY